MRKSFIQIVMLCVLSTIISSCVRNSSNKTEETADSLTVASTKSQSPYAQVTQWTISVTAVTTPSEGEHGLDIIGVVEITDPYIVGKLNAMMQDPAYSDYEADAKASGNTAKALWYGGNRGGGIYDDFPREVGDYILDRCQSHAE